MKPDPQAAAREFDQLASDYIYGSLGLSPVAATGAGYHLHNGVPLDELLDDYSAQGLDALRGFLRRFEQRIAALDKAALSKDQLADLEILNNSIRLSLLDLDTIQSYKHNPTVYVELAGSALFTPYMLNYAPIEKRFEHITRRLEKMPALFAQARANLVDAPEVWNRVAREENQGNIALIDKTLRAAAPPASRAAYDRAAATAVAALREFNVFLQISLSKKTSDWRLGRENYARKFGYVMAVGKTPEQLLAEAEADLKSVRARMARLAAPRSVPEALADVARQHSTPQTYVARARESLAEATAFVRAQDLLTLPTRSNLEVIETPEFMRGIYAVGGFNAAPPLEPHLGAFYWITPIPESWPQDRIESKLREYNDFGLQQLTIHEAMPGHYVQLEYANDVQPLTRRLLRSLFANGPYVEGYAVYAQQMMQEAGYLQGSVPLQLTFYKQVLRVLANTILDVRLHTMGMTDQQALDLMIQDTFQEKEEATAKLQRAQLSSCQLPTYYAGWKGWLELREKYKQRKGADYSLKQFNEWALRQSGVPLAVLEGLLE
jgi:uncharacterized protein (DUF885 family)